MSIDMRFSIAIAIVATVAYLCRCVGLIVGSNLVERTNVRRLFDILPACALGAVIGPSLMVMSATQTMAVAASVLVYLISSRFLLALAFGTAVLLCESWLPAHIH